MNIFFYLVASFFIFFIPTLLAEVTVRVISSYYNRLSLDLLPYLSISISIIFFIPILFTVTPGRGCKEKVKFLELRKVIFFNLLCLFFVMVCLWLFFGYVDDYFLLEGEWFMSEAATLTSGAASLAILLFAACVVAPLIEELVFRGWLYKKIEFIQPHIRISVIAIIFSLLHWQYEHFHTFISIFLVGMLLGYIRLIFNNLSYAVLAHVAYNLFTFVALL